jgi:hypothetical protein
MSISSISLILYTGSLTKRNIKELKQEAVIKNSKKLLPAVNLEEVSKPILAEAV